MLLYCTHKKFTGNGKKFKRESNDVIMENAVYYVSLF